MPKPRVEWSTIALLFAVYAAFCLLTAFHEALPPWALALLGGLPLALHGSLQHEAIHGHPTGSARLNALLVGPALSLWLPFGSYRRSHLAHHAAPLTDPHEDPESFYRDAATYASWSSARRALAWIDMTLIGRLTLGPFVVVARSTKGELARLARRERRTVKAWLAHVPAVAVVLLWLAWCELSFPKYVLCFVLPGLSLTLLRSFAEHHASGEHTAVVETNPLLSLLFLNNNLHTIHHAQPNLAWYAIPARYRRAPIDPEVRYYRGYLDVLRRHAFTPIAPPWHPSRPRRA